MPVPSVSEVPAVLLRLAERAIECFGAQDQRYVHRVTSEAADGSPFQVERAFARSFFSELSRDIELQSEILAAVEETLRRYDTGPWENRFGVGGIIEQIIGSAARALGFPVENAGAHLQKYDLELTPGVGLSVKAVFGPYSRSSRVRLTNSQGAEGVWDTGTFFLLTNVGIGYADSTLLPNATVRAGDGKSLDVAVMPLLQFWGITPRKQRGKPPQWLHQLAIPSHTPGYFIALPIPDRPAVPSPRLVSDPLALDILQSGRSPRLVADFRWSI